jgi:hypothetical protein
VYDVVSAGGITTALTPDALYRRGIDGAWTGPLREPSLGRLGRLYRVGADAGQLWVAGNGGAARYDERSERWFFYLVGSDIPEGPVIDVLPDGGDVWLATPAGALRLKWRR